MTESSWRQFRFRCPIVGRKHAISAYASSESSSPNDAAATQSPLVSSSPPSPIREEHGSPAPVSARSASETLARAELISGDANAVVVTAGGLAAWFDPTHCLCLIREPQNPRDPFAIRVARALLPTPALEIIGHTPARLSAALAPLLDASAVTVCARLCNSHQVDSDLEADAEAELFVCVRPQWLQHRDPRHEDRLRHHFTALTEFIEWIRVDRTHRFVDNFRLVTASVAEQYLHLFTDGERRAIQRFHSLSIDAQHLYCRLMLRKQASSPLLAAAISAVSVTPMSWPSRWFQAGLIRYRPVRDLSAALDELRITVIDETALPPEALLDEGNQLSLVPLSPSHSRTFADSEAELIDEDASAGSRNSSHASEDTVSVTITDDREYTDRIENSRKDKMEDCSRAHSQPHSHSHSYWSEVGFIESSTDTILPAFQFYSSIFDCLTLAKIKDFCQRAGIRVKLTGTAATVKSALLALMQKQRTISGVTLLDDPRCRRALHTECGKFYRLKPQFLELCQRVHRVFFLSEDVSQTSIASAVSPINLEDLGRARWFKSQEIRAMLDTPDQRASIFPSRECFLAYDRALHVRDCMSFAMDDFDAEFRAGQLNLPLAVACLCHAWRCLLAEREADNSSIAVSFPVSAGMKRAESVLNGHSKHIDIFDDGAVAGDYSRFFDVFHPVLSYCASDSFEHRFRAAWIYADICYYGITALERVHLFDDAVYLLFALLELPYCSKRRGHWWNRLVLNLATHQQNKAQALVVARLGCQDVHVRTGDRVELEQRVRRLEKELVNQCKQTQMQKGNKPKTKARQKRKSPSSLAPASLAPTIETLTIQGRPLNREVGAKSRFVNFSGDCCSVETLVLEHYGMTEHGEWRGEHCENALLLTLFGLLMWDCIFAALPKVFHCQFQHAPLDLYTDQFYAQRRSAIEARIKAVARADVSAEVRSSYWRHRGQRCAGVQWRRWSCEELEERADAIGSRALAEICRVLAVDYAHWVGGLPDLFLWKSPAAAATVTTDNTGDEDDDVRVIDPRSARCLLVEVKGPRDRLSAQQRAWLAQLAPHIRVTVAFVKENHELMDESSDADAINGGSGNASDADSDRENDRAHVGRSKLQREQIEIYD